MGYGPRVHLFLCICLLGSAAGLCHVLQLAEKQRWWEVAVRETVTIKPDFTDIILSAIKKKKIQHPQEQWAVSSKWKKPSRARTKQKSPDSPTCRGFSRGCAAVKYDYFFWPKQSDSVENSPGFSIPKGYLCMLSNLYCANRAWQGLTPSVPREKRKRKRKKILFTKRKGWGGQ